jgi:hypothetical protein
VKAGSSGGLKIGMRIDVRESGVESREIVEGEIGIHVPIENEEIEGRTTETVRFPGVETPLG